MTDLIETLVKNRWFGLIEDDTKLIKMLIERSENIKQQQETERQKLLREIFRLEDELKKIKKKAVEE